LHTIPGSSGAVILSDHGCATFFTIVIIVIPPSIRCM
jgi:hypothetical protein